MRTSGTRRTAGAWAPLLLLVLALGVFAMHTVGHPETDAPAAAPGPAYGVAAPASGDAPAGHGGGPAAALADPERDRPSGGHGGHGDPGDSGAGTAMDMLALCVAVLGTALLAALLRAALGRRPDWLVRLRTGALVVTRRGPPPRAPDLAALSILRI